MITPLLFLPDVAHLLSSTLSVPVQPSPPYICFIKRASLEPPDPLSLACPIGPPGCYLLPFWTMGQIFNSPSAAPFAYRVKLRLHSWPYSILSPVHTPYTPGMTPEHQEAYCLHVAFAQILLLHCKGPWEPPPSFKPCCLSSINPKRWLKGLFHSAVGTLSNHMVTLCFLCFICKTGIITGPF